MKTSALVLVSFALVTASMLLGCPDKDSAGPDKPGATAAPSAAPAAKPAASAKGGW